VDKDNRILSVGYNGFPRGCSDDALPWAREAESPLDTKYMYVCHAEVNAVMNKNTASLDGARLYVGLFPCNECAKIIVQAGIREVVYLSDKYHDMPSFVASRRLFDMAGVVHRQLKPTTQVISIDMRSEDAVASPALKE
jgi:dCMP deaminase